MHVFIMFSLITNAFNNNNNNIASNTIINNTSQVQVYNFNTVWNQASNDTHTQMHCISQPLYITQLYAFQVADSTARNLPACDGITVFRTFADIHERTEYNGNRFPCKINISNTNNDRTPQIITRKWQTASSK